MAKKIDFRLLLDRLRHISFDVETLKRYAWILHLFIIFLFAKTLSNITVSYLDSRMDAPVARKRVSRMKPRLATPSMLPLQDFESILKRNIFNPNAPDEDLIDRVKEIKHAFDEAGAIPTSLPFKLVGSIILTDPKRSVIAIRDTEKNQLESYQMGDVISETAKVYKVTPFKAYFQNMKSGQLEYLEIKKEAKKARPDFGPSVPIGEGIREAGAGRYVIDRGALEATLADPNAILTQARAVPNIVGGKIRGFRIFSIRPGSVYEQLGIKNGDVVLRVNDVDLDSPAKALEFYGTISSATNISIDVERGGQRMSFQYSVR